MQQQVQANQQVNTVGHPVIVDVFADPDPGPKGVIFSHDWRFDPGVGHGNTHIVLPAGSGSHVLQFKLHDRTDLKLEFAGCKSDDASQAMWVGDGSYPTGPGNGGQIDLANGHCSKNLLRVEDANSGDACTLIYQLWFDGKNGQVDYDPEIRNGGGGTVRTSSSFTTLAVAAVGIALVVLVLLLSMGKPGQ
ncbi:MAG: hypothetical protein ABI422_03855 [Sphingomicrobium sp.]